MPRRSTDIPDGLVRAARTALIPVSHRLPPRGYDEPESLSYAISSICPLSADGEHGVPAEEMAEIPSISPHTFVPLSAVDPGCSPELEINNALFDGNSWLHGPLEHGCTDAVAKARHCDIESRCPKTAFLAGFNGEDARACVLQRGE